MRLIDADALYETLCHLWDKSDSEDFEKGVFRIIINAPSIEPKQGEWKTIDTKVISVPVYWNEEQRQSDKKGAGISEKCECSVCGWRTSFMGYKKLGVYKSYNFCPNCGARMKGADDE